jgi:hypothetical protein
MDGDRAQGASCTGVGGQGKGQDMANGHGALVVVGESTLEQTADTAC